MCLVTDYAEGGDLLQFIRECERLGVVVPEGLVWRYFYQICQGLGYLHSLNIIHRDIKAANMLLDRNKSHILVGDMNVSKIAKAKFLYTQTGTPYYSAPEIWKGKPYGSKADVWSLGCLIYELCSYGPPFQANEINELRQKVLQ
jgi:NIMA (never in mitosis gene a)-related kinase